MTALLLLPTILSLLLMGAHFLRGGSTLLVAAMLVLAALTTSRRPWVARVLQAVLVVGALNWAAVAFLIARLRMAAGAPWQRMAVILGTVALFTLVAALLIQTRTLKRWFRIDRSDVSPSRD